LVRDADGPLRLVLITGTATALLFWLSTSFWMDAWRQRVDASTWRQETIVQDALLAAARALAAESMLSDGADLRALFGMDTEVMLTEAREASDAALIEAVSRLRRGGADADAVGQPSPDATDTGAADHLARLHAHLRLDRAEGDETSDPLSLTADSAGAAGLRNALDVIVRDVHVQLDWRPRRARSRDAQVERLQRVRASVQTLIEGVVADVRFATGDYARGSAVYRQDERARLRAVDASYALAALVHDGTGAELRPDTLARIGDTLAKTRAMFESASSGTPLDTLAFIAREREAFDALRGFEALDRTLAERAHHRLDQIQLKASRRLLIDSALLAICVVLVVMSAGLLRSLRHRATHDPLTGLADRAHFERQLERALSRRADDAEVALSLLDLDGFKHVNDTLGREAGDRVLKTVAARLRGEFECAALVGRLGGDEFGLVLTGHDAGIRAARALATLVAELDTSDAFHGVGTSAGLAVAPHDGASAPVLLRRADLSMYGAKDAGGGRVWRFAAEAEKRMDRELALRAGLERALREDGLELHYQPKISISDGRVRSVEALLRWRRSSEEMVSPAEFVPVAERCGLIVPIGTWALEEACRTAASWRAAGVRAPRIAVNVSAVQLAERAFVETVQRCLRENTLAADALELEVTEGVMMEDVDTVIDRLERLREMGLRVSVDDFGTGFSSLRWIDRLPLDCLKIDRSFVQRLDEGPPERSLAQKIVMLAHSFGLEVVAEGVETATQFSALAEFGCDEVQGWLFAPAVPGAELADIIARIEADAADDGVATTRRVA